MTLRKAFHKTQSSLSLLQFAMVDLEYIKKNFYWKQFAAKIQKGDKGFISRNKKDYYQKIDEILISIISYHIEIMKQSLHEHIMFLQIPSSDFLNKLRFFLLDFRNAFSHFAGELIPKFDRSVRTKQPLLIHIPIKCVDTCKEFTPNSIESFSLNCIAKPNKKIKLNRHPFITNLYLLSCHILEILKKQKLSTLEKYLRRINCNSKGERFP